MSNELLRIIDDFRDAHGQPSDASVARALGIAPQTLSSWRKRGVRELPNKEALLKLASLTRRSYADDVLPAVLLDIGYLTEAPTPPAEDETA